jgi:hypothetical protein
VVQRHLYQYLAEAGHELVFSASRDIGTAPMAKLHGLTRGFIPAHGPVDVYLSTVPPLPLTVRAPILTVVHDLRWQRTRSRIGSAYRAWDLHRTVRRSDALMCVSATTYRALTAFDADAVAKASVQRPGPGQIPDGSFHDSDSGLLMLVGGAVHKRNELAAAALAFARPAWVRGIIGVAVSEQVRAKLSDSFACEWFDDVSDTDMLALYQRAQYFIMLGTDEGFGIPFVEALAAGCQVIATDHPLAREVVGDAGLLIAAGNPAAVGQQLVEPPAVPAKGRARHMMRFSWTAFGQAYEAELLKIARPRRERREVDLGCSA